MSTHTQPRKPSTPPTPQAAAPTKTPIGAAGQTMLLCQGFSIRYPQTPAHKPSAVEQLDVSLQAGDIACLIGASGCGKTTALRGIAGFLALSHGTVELAGQVLSDTQRRVPPQQRGIGLMFQDLALFPHMTVADNIAFGLGKLSKTDQSVRVAQLLDVVGLQGLAHRYPHALSGGQQQRVALARALAPKPSLLLLDEPFSSLDANLRRQLALDIRLILKAEGVTALMVTHDQHEAFAFADYVGVMNQGRMEQWASPYTLYHEPATRYVAQFIGEGTFLLGTRTRDAAHEHQHVSIELGDITPADTSAHAHDEKQIVEVLLRPDDVVHDDASDLQAVVVRKAFRGAEFLYTLKLHSGREVLALVPSHHDHAVGEPIGIRLEADHVVTFEV